MVKLTHPGLSAAASGSLANAITFSHGRRSAYLKKKPTPKQPRSGAQVSMRAMMEFLVRQWPMVPPAQIPNWENAFPGTKTNAYNAWIKLNLSAWRDRLTPSHIFPPDRTQEETGGIQLTAAGGVRHVTLTAWDTPTYNPTRWGLLFHRYGAWPGSPFDRLIHVFWTKLGVSQTWKHTPLQTGTHYYSVYSATGAGACGWEIYNSKTALVT